MKPLLILTTLLACAEVGPSKMMVRVPDAPKSTLCMCSVVDEPKRNLVCGVERDHWGVLWVSWEVVSPGDRVGVLCVDEAGKSFRFQRVIQ